MEPSPRGYPSGGNYWRARNGPSQNEVGSDGIGDPAHSIGASTDTDHYPLFNYWAPTETSVTVNGNVYPVIITTNTTITHIDSTSDILNFTVTKTDEETGYVRVILPVRANSTNLQVHINGTNLESPYPIITSNSTHEITILLVPEYLLSSIFALVSFLAAYGTFRKLKRPTSIVTQQKT